VTFFNGRLLTGQDLSREQDAQRQVHLRLGRIAGAGIVRGLDVSGSPGATSRTRPAVTVAAGLAVNRLGQSIELSEPVALALGATRAPSDATARLLFDDCTDVPPGTVPSGSGVFVLAAGPSRSGRGRAAVSGLRNVAAACDVALSVEGVRFRLVRVHLDAADVADPDKLRNRVAYRFFGTTDTRRTALEHDPLGARVEAHGLIDDLGGECLHETEIPLAVIRWTAAVGIVFVDRWTVRRRVVRAAAESDRPLLTGERPAAEAEAMLGQFQDHVDDLRRTGDPSAVEARTFFDVLPPAGLVPLRSAGHPRGFELDRFFTGIKCAPPVFVEGAALEALVRDALGHPPTLLATGEAIRIYRIFENQRDVDTGVQPPPQRVALFVNGHAAHRGNARFDLAHYDYANAAERAG
jgi:hypothetical protein